jgi:hypothetical protein
MEQMTQALYRLNSHCPSFLQPLAHKAVQPRFTTDNSAPESPGMIELYIEAIRRYQKYVWREQRAIQQIYLHEFEAGSM